MSAGRKSANDVLQIVESNCDGMPVVHDFSFSGHCLWNGEGHWWVGDCKFCC